MSISEIKNDYRIMTSINISVEKKLFDLEWDEFFGGWG